MLHFTSMEELTKLDEIAKIKQELEHARAELTILYEISNAMRTTLKLDEILYIILTGVTAHTGLGFNRALLFLVNENYGIIEGKMAIGPETQEEANRIWNQIEQEKMDFEDLINVYKLSGQRNADYEYMHAASSRPGFGGKIQHLKFPLNEETGGLLIKGSLEGMPLHLTKDTIRAHSHDPIVRILATEELVIVPLRAKDKVNGLIIADNFVTKKPISKNDIRMLTMLGNQAGLAIENSQLYEQTVMRSHSDSLTSLWNHGYFQYLLQTEMEKAQAIRTPLSLIMLDIDDFKVYNDKLGHQAGDKILVELASLLKKQSRKMDYVCRYGGEEFTVILPQTEHNEAYLLAERLREHIQNHSFVQEEVLPNKKLTISIGLSTFPQDGSTAATLIGHSDRALYQAKHKGKNYTCS